MRVKEFETCDENLRPRRFNVHSLLSRQSADNITHIPVIPEQNPKKKHENNEEGEKNARNAVKI